MNKRDFLSLLAIASSAGCAIEAPLLRSGATAVGGAGADLYQIPRFGNVSLLHMTDCHAQLLPSYFREPSVNLGIAGALGKAPHLVGEQLLRSFGIAPNSSQAHAFTYLDFEAAARLYGKVGGFAHIATLVKRLRADRPDALLLDGGDTWQGSATALWTQGQDMVDASKLLGVDIMTMHWECMHGAQRVQHIVETDFKGRIEMLAQNIATADFGDPVFASHSIRIINGLPIAIIGQAFPYTPIANPRYHVAQWTFGIQEEKLQKLVNEVRSKGAHAVVLLSHNGMDVDLKLASRVTGIDFILGGHTHDGVPQAIAVSNRNGITQVTNAGSNGKFIGVLDIDVGGGKPRDFRYRLLPVFSNLLPADPAMQSLIDKSRAPYAAKLAEPLATTEGLLYRRGNFNGSWDQLILDALMKVRGADIAFSPGFRWGTTLLPGQTITRELMMDQLAITYPWTTLTEMTGATIKSVLEDVADNLFNPDPYLQQGGDMVRVGGLNYTCDPNAKIGARISDMTLNGVAIDADKRYKVAGWAPVAEEAKSAGGAPIWDVLETYLTSARSVAAPKLNQPRLIGMVGNPGIAA